MIQFKYDTFPSIGNESLWKASGYIQFSNQWAISIIYGSACYCSCRDSKTPQPGCPDVEIAIINPSGEMIPFKDGETVKAYTTADELASIMAWIVKQPSNGAKSNDEPAQS